MRKSSDEAAELLRRLRNLQSYSGWFRRPAHTGEIVAIIQKLTDLDEPSSISIVLGSLFDRSQEVQFAACRCLHRLLTSVPAEELHQVSIDLNWRGDLSEYWRTLSPAKVGSLSSDQISRTSILGLASLHANGYVREEAVRLLANVQDGDELRYLLIRQNDWVAPVSVLAQEAVQDRIGEENLTHFVACFPLLLQLGKYTRRDHSPVVRRIVKMLLQPKHAEVLRNLFASTNRSVRRSVVQLALELGEGGERHVIRLGLESEDGVIRFWCAKQLARFMSVETLLSVLQILLKDHFMPVRRAALLAVKEHFPKQSSAYWEAGLLDMNASIRELARTQLTKHAAFDVVELYRRTIANDPTSLAALLGLVEVGTKANLPLIRQHLVSELPRYRRAAVRGIARIEGASCVPELITLLQDDNYGVVSEARNCLKQWLHLADGNALYVIAASDPRQYVRITALRLIFEMGKWRSLPFLIRASAHEDEVTARLAQDFVEAWFSPPRCNRNFISPSSDEQRAISAAISETRGRLDQTFLHRLIGALDAFELRLAVAPDLR